MSKPPSAWPLRALSLAIAIVLWLIFSWGERQEQQESERAIAAVNVTYDTPEGFILVNPVSAIELRIRGPEETVRDINPFQFSVSIDLAPAPGIQEIDLTDAMVTGPPGVSITAITPNRLALEVDRRIERSLRVRVVTQGEPAAGAVEGEHKAVPSEVRVTGPETALIHRDYIDAPVSIAGRAYSFQQAVTLVTGDPLIQVQGSSTVQVQIVLETPTLSPDAANGGGRDESVR